MLSDLHSAVRSLRRSPGYALIAADLRAHRAHARGRRAGDARRACSGGFALQRLGASVLGVAFGTVIVLAVGRLLASQLYGVTPTDPLTLVATALLLTLVAMAASFIPARRATHVNPIIALRAD